MTPGDRRRLDFNATREVQTTAMRRIAEEVFESFGLDRREPHAFAIWWLGNATVIARQDVREHIANIRRARQDGAGGSTNAKRQEKYAQRLRDLREQLYLLNEIRHAIIALRRMG